MQLHPLVGRPSCATLTESARERATDPALARVLIDQPICDTLGTEPVIQAGHNLDNRIGEVSASVAHPVRWAYCAVAAGMMGHCKPHQGQIMQSHTEIKHEIDNAKLSLTGSSLTVVDSKSHDSVTVTGLSRVQVARELRYWLSYAGWSHYEAAADRDHMRDELHRMQTTLTEAIDRLTEKTEEVKV